MRKKLAPLILGLVCLANFSMVKADTPLEISMKHTSKAFKQLALDLKAPQEASKPDYLDLAATMKKESQTARGLVPKKAAALPDDRQAAMVTAYQKSMDDLIASIDLLTQDLQASNWAAAQKQIDVIRKQEGDGHKQFRNEEKHPASPTPPATSSTSTTPVPTTASMAAPPTPASNVQSVSAPTAPPSPK